MVFEIIFLQILAMSTVYMLSLLGEIIAEKSGVVNLSLEGSIALGASTAYAISVTSGSTLLALLGGGLAGVIPSLALAIASVYLAMNMIASGLAISSIFSAVSIVIGDSVPRVSQDRLVVSSEIFTIILLFVISLLLVSIAEFIVRGKIGLKIRSAGEDPYSAYSLGINIWRIRSLTLIIAGFLGGISGALMILTPIISIIWREGITSGVGFIIVAMTPLTLWSTPLAIPVSIFLGSISQVTVYLQTSGLIKISTEMSNAIPYIVALSLYTIFRVVLTKRRVRLGLVPRALGREILLEERYE
ncbi:MAG: hypothetical protein ABWJ42_04875 [Sulfolobales archaeon]